ncbi:cyclase family protein [Candidatus Bathyarchaeota archaeon]|nr:cyclase family protein [Candidatus Bathyarchaeota archaeon]MBS7612647.1 cyclase family protein [Candidatus Bathyarchaeota archaeon]MBS7617230.1 cyclase family protein [Candidatus Bathyarchaeota archaeon]
MKPVKIVDLSQVLYNCMPSWPTQPNLLYEMLSNVARDGNTMHMIRQMTTHSGTHIDAPLHFIVGGKSTDQLPIDAFAGEGLVVDLSYKKAGEPITINDLKAYENEIRLGDVLMLHTGWDKKFGFNPEYLFEWPYVIEETAEYLVEKKIKALGVDTLSVGGWDGQLPGHGPVAVEGSPARVHRILLGAGIILIESLRNLNSVLDGRKYRRAYFIYAPIAFKDSDGGPCRALAMIF